MSILKSIIIAFSMYSRIPMPVFNWEEKDMKHVITFLPLIGAVIGGIDIAALKISGIAKLPCMVITLILIIVPILVTGGFHLDGFMDVQDALKSYRSKEKKLEIMKDPHIGAFAVISLVSMGLIWIAALYCITYKALETENYELLNIYAALFAISRCACGITSIVFPNAKKDGMLNMEIGKTGKGDLTFLGVIALLDLLVMLVIKPLAAVICAVVIVVYSLVYKRICDSNFGGVTGDTSGYYIVVCECVLTVALGILSIWG